MLKRLIFVTALALAAAVAPVAAQNPPKAAAAQEMKEKAGPTLNLGDPAPKLSIEKWVKGSEVASFEKGKVYVVEFWATWCGPCIKSIPHLTKLQKEYGPKGVTIIGVSSKDPRNDLEKVTQLVAKQGDKMAYTVAYDVARTTSDAWMEASGQQGIPTSFVVDKEGRIAFIGHPMELDEVLPKVVDGTWNIAAEKERAEAAAAKEKEFLRVVARIEGGMKSGNHADVNKALAELADKHGNDDPQTLNQVAWTIADPESKLTEKDWALALRAAERANELTKGSDPAILDTLAHAQFGGGHIDKAIETQKKAIAAAESDKAMAAELSKALKRFEEAKAAKK